MSKDKSPLTEIFGTKVVQCPRCGTIYGGEGITEDATCITCQLNVSTLVNEVIAAFIDDESFDTVYRRMKEKAGPAANAIMARALLKLDDARLRPA